MTMRFDHAILAVQSLPESVSRLADRFGFDVQPGGKHTGFGTENALIRFGSEYLELLGVYDRDEVVAAGIKRAPLLDFIAQRKGGWLAYYMATDDIDSLAQRFLSIGLESHGPYAMQRVRPDGTILHWRLLVPGGTAWRRPWPFFIQWEEPETVRTRHETPGGHRVGAAKISGVRLIVRDLQAAKYLYGVQLGFECQDQEAYDLPGARSVTFGLAGLNVELVSPTAPGSVMHELEANGEGLSEIVLDVEDYELARKALSGHIVDGAHVTRSLTVDLMEETDPALQARLSVRK